MAKLFHMKYPPPGMRFADARRAGMLRETQSWYFKNERNQNVSTGTDNFKKAQAILKADMARRARGEPYVPQASHVTFADMAVRLRQDYDLNAKHRPTLDARLAHLEPFFGARRMADIRPADITDYITKRKAEGDSNGSVNRQLEVLSRAFTLGRKLGLLSVTLLRVRDHRLGEASPRQGFFEPAQYDAVMRHLTHVVVVETTDGKRKKVRVSADDLKLACAIAQTYGWRMQSEILTLERRQVSLDAADGLGTLSLDATQTKNDSARVVVLTPALRDALQEQLARVEAFQRATGTITPFLFVHTSGPHIGERIADFRRSWATACRKAGVPGMLRHDFRRTAVRGLVNAGVPERVAMEISGHKTRSVFDRYHIVSQADHVRAAQLLAAAAAPQGAKRGQAIKNQ